AARRCLRVTACCHSCSRIAETVLFLAWKAGRLRAWNRCWGACLRCVAVWRTGKTLRCDASASNDPTAATVDRNRSAAVSFRGAQDRHWRSPSAVLQIGRKLLNLGNKAAAIFEITD